jgi:hypothetical protein
MVVALATLPTAGASSDGGSYAEWGGGGGWVLVGVALGAALVALGIAIGMCVAHAWRSVAVAHTEVQTDARGATEVAPVVDPLARLNRSGGGDPLVEPVAPAQSSIRRRRVELPGRAQRLEEYHARMVGLRQRAARSSDGHARSGERA